MTWHAATNENTREVKAILDDAASLPISMGIEQWPNDFRPADIQAYIAAGGVYVFRQQGTAVGTVDYRHSDTQIWGSDASRAAYLHRLAVRRVAQGNGIGATILDWCIDKARHEGRTAVRLDCVVGNEKLQAYYRDFGFHFVTDVVWAGGHTALYQYDL